LNQALLIIDYTNDFVADNGILTCGKLGQALEDKIISLADEFLPKKQWVILPTDLHQKKNDLYLPEAKLLLPHNLAKTWGR
jgi:nicotinamidase-related amidase